MVHNKGVYVMTELDLIKEQHLNNYKNAVLEIIKNNTNSLVDDDIMLLINKPPLDSMDIIKGKFLAIAKKRSMVVKTEDLNKIVDTYRCKVKKELDFIRKLRIEELTKSVTDFKADKDYEIIKITKKRLSEINKLINTQLKKILTDDIEKLLIKKINKIFVEESVSIKHEDILKELTNFFKTTYKKQLIENINFKILVKDTTLINGVKEQGERYIFTKNNSRLNEI